VRSVETFVFQTLNTYRMQRVVLHMAHQAEQHLQKEFGIRLLEWRVLVGIFQQPGITASQLAPLILMTKMQASRTLATMVRRGLVKEGLDHADKRATPLHLTAKGVKLFVGAGEVVAGVEMWWQQNFTSDEMAALRLLLGKMEDQVFGQHLPGVESLRREFNESSPSPRFDYLFATSMLTPDLRETAESSEVKPRLPAAKAKPKG
jgi:DNA-binding MarR family transcriptional regulator